MENPKTKKPLIFRNSGNFLLVLLSFVSLILITVGCDGISGAKEAEPLYRNMEKWRAAKNNSNYQMKIKVVKRDVEGVYDVTVKDGKSVSIKPAKPDPKRPEYIHYSIEEFDTIEKLFGIIKREIKKGPSELLVEYEESSGYPVKFNVIPRADPKRLDCHDCFSFEVLEVTRLN